MYAVIESGAKQYRVSKGDIIDVESLPAAEGDRVALDRVLMVADADDTIIGVPTVEGASVLATVQGHDRHKKVIIYKHRKTYHKKQGHRQNFTRLYIEGIARTPAEAETLTAELEAEPEETGPELELYLDEEPAETFVEAAEAIEAVEEPEAPVEAVEEPEIPDEVPAKVEEPVEMEAQADPEESAEPEEADEETDTEEETNRP